MFWVIEQIDGRVTRSRSWASYLGIGSSKNSYTEYLTNTLKHTYEALNDVKYILSLREEAVEELKYYNDNLLTSKEDLQR